MGITENEFYKEVHPTFLYESLCTFVIFIILYKIRNKRKYKGELTYKYLLLYSLSRAVIESLRADSLMLRKHSHIYGNINSFICYIFTNCNNKEN